MNCNATGAQRLKMPCVAVIAIAWMVGSYVLLGCYTLPGMDNWCYFAPGMSAAHPLELHMPLLGSFHGADKAWGIHWPGALWFYSLFGWAIGNAQALHPLLFMGLLLLLAALTLRLGQRIGLNGMWAWVPVAGVLFDRQLINTAAQQRPEIVAACVLVGWALAIGSTSQSTLRMLCVCGCAILLAICHPLTFCFAAGTLPIAAWIAWRNPTARKALLWHAGGAVIGITIFSGRLWLNPDAMDQFRDHASMNKGALFNATPWLAAWDHFKPLPLGLLGIVLALIVAVTVLWFQRTTPAITVESAACLALVGLIAAGHLFVNPHYLRIAVPLVLVLCCTAIARFGPVPAAGFHCSAVAMLVVTVVPSLLWWGYMLNAARRDQFPVIRRDLQAFYDSAASTSGHTCIPDVLWQAGVLDHRNEVTFVTPPYTVSPARRDEYEQETYGALGKGDVVIVDAMAEDNVPRSRPWLDQHWPVIGHAARRLSTRAAWGYDLTAYRKP